MAEPTTATFILSDKLNVTVKEGDAGSDSYIEFNRQTRYGTSRSVPIVSQMWFTLLNLWDELSTSLSQKEEITKRVTDTYTIQVRQFAETNVWYVCLMYTVNNRHVFGKCLNFNSREWEALRSRVTVINAQIKRYDSARAAINNVTTPTCIKQFKWVLDYPSNVSLSTAGEWLFDKLASQAEGRTMRVKLNSETDNFGILSSEERTIPAPSLYVIARQVLLCLLQIQLGTLSNVNCQACMHDLPDQLSHMKGCLAEWGQTVVTFFDQARQNVSREETTRIVYCVARYLELPTEYCSIATDGVLYLIPPAEIENQLVNQMLDPAYESLVKAILQNDEEHINHLDTERMI